MLEMVLQLILLVLGFAMLVKGADWFVDGAAGIAGRFGIPQLVIGLTIVAMGTSAPEAAVSITAALKDSADITIGNIVGSNILNVLIILGLSAVISPLPVAKSTVLREIPFMILITGLLYLLGMDGSVGLGDGLILWAAFLVYLGYLFWMSRKNHGQMEQIVLKRPLWKLLLLTAVGLACIVLGSRFTVDAASALARAFGLSERFIGLTIVALGTSLPELFTSVNAARKGNADIAIGNIVGSNLFNILFVVGTSALITPVRFASDFYFDTLVAGFAAILLLVCSLRRYRLGRIAGGVMLACYAAYFVIIL